jgi:tetratricopeptide (TPR) repeat protein
VASLSNLDARRRAALTAGLVAVAAVVVYLNSLANGFAYDDTWVIQDRDLVHDLRRFWEIISSPYWPVIFESGLYRPLTLLSFAVDWAVWDGRAFGFHLVNVLLHAATSALVVLLLLRYFPWWASLAGGLVFAVHPVHTEAVANVVGRGEILATFFGLAACLLYMRAVRGGGLSARAVALVAAAYGLATLSKEGGVVVIALLLATDLPLVPSGRLGTLRQYLRARLPLILVLSAVLAAYLAARWAVLGVAVASVPDPVFTVDSSFPTRLFTMSRVWPRYLELLLVPFQLSADYAPAIILPVDRLTPLGAAAFLTVLALLAMAVLVFRRAPEFAMALAWVAISLAPVSNLLVIAEIVLAERTLYMPSVGFSIVVALLLARARPAPRRLVALVVALWVVVFSVVTVRRNVVWYSTDTVFEDLRHKHPESMRLLFGVASQFRRDGQWEEARKWYRRAFEIWPHHGPFLVEYGYYLYEHGEYEEADSVVARAVSYHPRQKNYVRFLAAIRARAGKWQGVLETTEAGLARVGPDPFLYQMQCEAYLALGDTLRAIDAQAAAARVTGPGGEWAPRLRLAELRLAAGDTAGALEALRWAREAREAQLELADSLERAWTGIK